MNQEIIDKLRRIYKESTNSVAKEGAKKKLQDAGIPLTDEKPKSEPKKMNQETIDKLRRIYKETTNAVAKEGAKKKLQDAGVSLGDEKPKAEAKAKKPKAQPKAKAESNEKPTSKDDEYDCDDLIKQVKERKAKAKANAQKRANEPKKSPATKNKERVEKATSKVEKNVETRAKKGEVKVTEIEKLIAEYEDAIKKLKALLSKVKSGKKFARGGNMGIMDSESASAFNKIKDHNCGCGDKKMAKGGKVKERDTTIDREYRALKGGKRTSSKYASVEMRGGGVYHRRNANQYGKVKGGKTYTENRPNRTDAQPRKYLAKGGNIGDFKLKDIKNYSVAELYNFRAKAILSQGNGSSYSQMLENRIEKLGEELTRRGEKF